jgi:hypothetical protein
VSYSQSNMTVGTDGRVVQLDAITVEDLHRQLGELIAKGLGKVPVVGSDLRAHYPMQVYPVYNSTGYVDAVLCYVRPDLHFTPENPNRDPGADRWFDRHLRWNDEADAVRARMNSAEPGSRNPSSGRKNCGDVGRKLVPQAREGQR